MIAFPALLRVLDQEDVMNVNVRRGLRLGVVLLAVTVGSMAAARADESEGKARQSHFRPRDIKGPYGFSCSGAVVASDVLPVGPAALVGQVSCDGVETCSGTSMASFNGIIFPPLELTGIYTVNPNGTGFITYDLTIGGEPAGQLPIQFVITEGGRGIKGLPVNDGFVFTCDLKTQKGND
jgi:hypothetical protein